MASLGQLITALGPIVQDVQLAPGGLDSAYGKLQITSRAELARALAGGD